MINFGARKLKTLKVKSLKSLVKMLISKKLKGI